MGLSMPQIDGLLGMPGPAYGDSIGAMTIVGGISAALFAREKTGEPSVVDTSLLAAGAWANALAPHPDGLGALTLRAMPGATRTAARHAPAPGSTGRHVTGVIPRS